MEEINDLALIGRFQSGDPSAFGDIILKYQDKIYNLCRYMLGNADDAEDAAQDVFLKAYQALPKFQPKASLYTWLYRIAANTCMDYRRKPVLESLFGRSEEGERFIHDRPTEAPSPERLYQARQMDRALRECLGRLSAKLRAVIVLREVEDLSYEEIADTLEISMGTVKSRMARAREELQDCMKRNR